MSPGESSVVGEQDDGKVDLELSHGEGQPALVVVKLDLLLCRIWIQSCCGLLGCDSQVGPEDDPLEHEQRHHQIEEVDWVSAICGNAK